MKRVLFAATLVFLLGGGGAPPMAGFPGGADFTGKVKCVTTFDEGAAFTSTDVVTLSFFQTMNSPPNRQDGTVGLDHTETSGAGIHLDDEGPLAYTAVLDVDEGKTGLVAIQDDEGFLSGAVVEYKPKSDGSIGSLRFVSTHGFDDQIQRCSGTLKRVPKPA